MSKSYYGHFLIHLLVKSTLPLLVHTMPPFISPTPRHNLPITTCHRSGPYRWVSNPDANHIKLQAIHTYCGNKPCKSTLLPIALPHSARLKMIDDIQTPYPYV